MFHRKIDLYRSVSALDGHCLSPFHQSSKESKFHIWYSNNLIQSQHLLKRKSYANQNRPMYQLYMLMQVQKLVFLPLQLAAIAISSNKLQFTGRMHSNITENALESETKSPNPRGNNNIRLLYQLFSHFHQSLAVFASDREAWVIHEHCKDYTRI